MDGEGEKYAERVELKARMRELGVSAKDVARELGVCPSSVYAKLNGFVLFRSRELSVIEGMLREAEGFRLAFEEVDEGGVLE